jgi:hypothetical protein
VSSAFRACGLWTAVLAQDGGSSAKVGAIASSGRPRRRRAPAYRRSQVGPGRRRRWGAQFGEEASSLLGQVSGTVPLRGPGGLRCGKRQASRVNSEPETQPPVSRGRKARRRSG